jgi:hypothetical protein
MSAPPTNGMAIAALILGIVSVLGICCYGLPGFVLGIAAVVLGAIARKNINASNGTQVGGGMATAGLIMGIVGVALGIIVAIMMAFIVSTPEFQREFDKGFNEGFDGTTVD